MDKLQKIKDESLHDGKGVIVHIDNFNWLIDQAEKTEFWKQRFFEENKKLLDMIYEKTMR